MSTNLSDGIGSLFSRGKSFISRIAYVAKAMPAKLTQRLLGQAKAATPSRPSAPTANRLPRRSYAQAGQRALGFVPYRVAVLPESLPALLVAFYLPQFHAIPENDEWWGRGFTEWRNVSRALPQFEGHAQPRIPSDLGMYDLGNPEVMRDQVRLAREYGIGAFCFYYYWFNGKTLLDSPVERWLLDASLNLSFCLCWANENWTRRWDGRDDEILIGQNHGAADDLAFIQHVSRFLLDPRYLRVDGKPMLLVYRPGLMPDARETAGRWRNWCRENGIGEIHLAYVQSFERPVPDDIGYDSAVEFPPNVGDPTNVVDQHCLINPDYAGEIMDWRELAAEYRQRPKVSYPIFPAVNCGWDNEPRRPGKGRSFIHASPRAYRDWLQDSIDLRLANAPESMRLVFINAWNEWAEGAVLEPDTRLGHAWLEATRSALTRSAQEDGGDAAPVRPCVVIHAWYLDAFDEILRNLQVSQLQCRLVVTTSPDKSARVRAALDSLGIVAEIEIAENRGRDILPFLRTAYRLLEEGEQVVLKLHTKQSPHRQDGEQWRNDILSRLLSPGRAERIFQAFCSDPGLGLVAPEGHIQPLAYYWGANRENVNYLATRIGIPLPDSESDSFVAGSMFWLRLDALRPLLDAHLDEREFEAEAGQVDGTFAHAVERIFALCTRSRGLRMESASKVCLEPEAPAGSYPYASSD